ncbi:MAG: hypothetical protein ACRDVE_20395 [Actinocrinis sp.]
MSASSSHGRGSGPEGPLRRTSRAESTRARRERRSWRTRKFGTMFAVMPIVVIAAVGVAIASPRHHHHRDPNGGAAACTSTATSAAAGNAGMTTTAANMTTTGAAASGNASSAASGAASGAPSNASTTAAAGTTTGVTTGTSAAASTAAAGNTGAGTGTTTAPAANCQTTSPAATASTVMAGGGAGGAATPNPNCSLIVPPDPLSAQGLATPYQLVATDAAMGACNEANANQSAFVQAAIYDPASGAITVYEPLVVDQGTQPAAAPVVPTLPNGAVVGIWFGFNATNLTLQDSNGSVAAGKCVNGMGNGDVFGQFAYCDGPAFFTAVNGGVQGGKVQIPALGTSTDGQACESIRDFALIDQDQSDNVPTAYLAAADGRTAQKNAANSAAMAGAATISNPSDNGLLDALVDPALGCKPWTVPDLSADNQPMAALALDEIQANALQRRPSALVPVNDPMALLNGTTNSDAKTNLYRVGVDQPALPAGQSAQQYCADMDAIQGARLQQDVNLLINAPSPDTAAADSLWAFLGMRLQQSFGNLNCQNFGLTNPVSAVGTDANGIVVSVVYARTVNPVTAGSGNPAQKCVNTRGATAQAACALAAVGMPTGPASASPTAPPPVQTATPRPRWDMRHHSGHHW